MKAWADAVGPDPADSPKVLRDIEVLAQFRPNDLHAEHGWLARFAASPRAERGGWPLLPAHLLTCCAPAATITSSTLGPHTAGRP